MAAICCIISGFIIGFNPEYGLLKLGSWTEGNIARDGSIIGGKEERTLLLGNPAAALGVDWAEAGGDWASN